MQFAVFLLNTEFLGLQIVDPLLSLFPTSLSRGPISLQELPSFLVNMTAQLAGVPLPGAG